jgi:hypothetical protein
VLAWAGAGSEGVIDLHIRQLGHARDQFSVVMSLTGSWGAIRVETGCLT